MCSSESETMCYGGQARRKVSMATATNKRGRKPATRSVLGRSDGSDKAPSPASKGEGSQQSPEGEAPAFAIITEIKIPTKLSGVCAKEESRYACSNVILRREETAGRGILLATDGRAAAIVPTDLEDHASGAEVPNAIPAALAKPTSKGARDLRFGIGPTKTLFGVERVWVDEADMRFEPEAGGESPLRFGQVVPELTKDMVYVGVNVEMLAVLAAAVNSPEGQNCKTQVVLAFKPKDNGVGAISVIGDAGIGVLMSTSRGSYELDAPAHEMIRRRLIEAERDMEIPADMPPVAVSLTEPEEDDPSQGKLGGADPLGDDDE